MRKLLRKAHYGTTCPGVVHVPQKMRIFLASILRRARIGFTPFLLLKTARIQTGERGGNDEFK